MTPQQRIILAIAVKEGTVDMVRLQSRSGSTRKALRDLAKDGYLIALPQPSMLDPKPYRWTGKPPPPKDGAVAKANMKKHDATTVRFAKPLSSRRRMFDPDQPAVTTKRTKITVCPSAKVYSNVQVAPGERVPAIFSALGPGRYLDEV